MISLDRLGAQVGTILVRLEVRRPQRDDLVVVGFRRGQIAEEALHGGPIENEVGVVGRQRHGALEGLQGVPLISGKAVKAAERVQQHGVSSMPVTRPRRRSPAPRAASHRQETLRLIEQHARHAGTGLERSIDLNEGVRPVARLDSRMTSRCNCSS
jgi:hypothetical protein